MSANERRLMIEHAELMQLLTHLRVRAARWETCADSLYACVEGKSEEYDSAVETYELLKKQVLTCESH